MGLLIENVMIPSVSLDFKAEGKNRITGKYELVSSTGISIAKLGFNGYGDIEVAFSSNTQKLVIEFAESIKKDLENTIGLTKGGEVK